MIFMVMMMTVIYHLIYVHLVIDCNDIVENNIVNVSRCRLRLEVCVLSSFWSFRETVTHLIIKYNLAVLFE